MYKWIVCRWILVQRCSSHEAGTFYINRAPMYQQANPVIPGIVSAKQRPQLDGRACLSIWNSFSGKGGRDARTPPLE